MQTSAIDTEVAALTERYGAPLVEHVVLQGKMFDPLSKRDRYGEVCMVVRRANGKLLTAIKTFYPRGAYRLLTGGIHHDEPIFTALLRETEEETSLVVEVRRFLNVIHYRHEKDDPNQPPTFSTFAFLLDEVGGVLHVSDPDERLEEFREIEIEELPAQAEFLANLAADPSEEIEGRWSDWGQFRAVVHRAVYTALTGGTANG